MKGEREMRAGAAGASGAESALREVLAAAYPAAEPSPELQRRVAAFAAGHEERAARRSRWGRRVRLGLTLAGASAAVLLAALLAPQWVAAQALRRMEAAVNDVRSAHVVEWRVGPDGSRVRESETWYQSGRWRIENPRRIQVFADGRLWSYEPEMDRVTVQRRPGPFGHNPSGFSLGAMARDIAHWGWRDRIRVLGERTAGGRRLREVVIERVTEPARLRLWVDAASDLPVRMAIEREQHGRWSVAGAGEFRFHQPLPARLFAPRFPRSARVVDLDAERQEWHRRLEAGIARRKVGDRTIVIRDLQVNTEGDVFVLYTAGKSPGDETYEHDFLRLSDDRGTQYLRASASISAYLKGIPRLSEGVLCDGEQVEGTWWMPLEPQDPWRGRQFTLTIRVPAAAGQGHGAAGSGLSVQTARLTLPVERPSATLLPDYMLWIPGGGLQEYQVRMARAGGRAHYYRHAERDLERALAFYRQEIEAGEEYSRAIGQRFHQPDNWFSLYEVLRELGRLDEARNALRRARDECTYRGDNYTWQRIQKALRETGAGG